MVELDGSWVIVDVVRDGELGAQREELGDVAVLCSTVREPAGGGRGRKLDCRRGDGETGPRTGELKRKESAQLMSLEGGPG